MNDHVRTETAEREGRLATDAAGRTGDERSEAPTVAVGDTRDLLRPSVR